MDYDKKLLEKEKDKKNVGEGENLEKEVSHQDMGTEVLDPFARRDAIPRSPTRIHASSWGSLEDLKKINKPLKPLAKSIYQAKRKRFDNNGEDTTNPPNGGGDSLQTVLDEICNQVELLQHTLSDMYKPKKELQEICTKLLLEKEKLMDQTIREQIREVLEPQRSVLGREQSEDVFMVKCENCTKATKREARRRELLGDRSYDSFQRIKEVDWSEEILSPPKRVKARPWDVLETYDIALPCGENLKSSHNPTDRAIKQFGGRAELLKQRKEKGHVARMAHSMSFPDKDGNFSGTYRHIYYPIFSSTEKIEDARDEHIFLCAQEILTYMARQGRTKLAVPDTESVTGVVFVRMLTFLTANTDTEIAVFEQEKQNDSANRPPKPDKKQESQYPAPGKRRPPGDAILVKGDNKTYADLLKTLKATVNPGEMGVEIGKISKTRAGELLLTVRNGKDKAEVLKKELSEKIPQISASIMKSNKIVHIKDMDEITEMSEIREAISKTLKIPSESYEVRALRPAYGNTQNATLIMEDKIADKLLEMKRIRIGWGMCRVIERKKETRCRKCWLDGHLKAQCNGPDREGKCLKCNGEGHKAANCPNPPFCVLCEKEGHQTGSKRCPKTTVRSENSGDSRDNVTRVMKQ